MIVYKNDRPVQITQHQVDLIKRLCAKDATEDEFELFMTICKKSRLDPFKKQIYCVIFTGERTGRNMVIITGIDGFRSMAARDHKDFAGTDAAVFTWTNEKTPLGKRIPETATVTAKRTNGITTTATAYWEEFAPANLGAARSEFWNKMPKVMLEKCAEARALRKAFPGLGNIFTPEEMDQKMQDYTEQGGKIFVNGKTPSGQPRIEQGSDSETLEAIEKCKAQGLWCELHNCTRSEKHLRECEPSRKAMEAKRKAASTEQTKPRRAETTENLKQGAIDVKPEPQPKGLDEVWPKGEKKPPSKAKEKSMEGMQLVNGTLHNTIHSHTSEKNTPVLNVKILNTWYKCYRTSIFDALAGSHGNAVTVWIDPKSHNLVGLRRIGMVEYENDGKSEKALQLDREPGNGRK